MATEASKNRESEEMIEHLVKKRGIVKRKLTLFANFITSLEILENTALSITQKTEIEVRLQKAEALLNDFAEVQDEIDLLLPDSQLACEIEERQSFENRYYSLVANAKCLLNLNDPNIPTSQEMAFKPLSSIKLPTIKLPTFDGSYDQWLEFKDTYLSLIHHSKDIDDIQKFHYLRSALTGNALQVIKSLEFSAENYSIAWDLLENRYNNDRLLLNNHLKALFVMQSMNKESSAQLRKLIDSILRNLRSLKMLGEPTESWDSIVIFTTVSKLDATTEREWENYAGNLINNAVQGNSSSGSNMTRPKIKIDDFMRFLKNRADVLEMVKVSNNNNKAGDNNSKKPQSNQVNNNNNTHSYVATQTNNENSKNNKNKSARTAKRSRVCNLCDGNHALYSCNKFLTLSINDKSKFIEDKKLCRNCLRVGHTDANCWFGPCKQCNLKHNSLLQCTTKVTNESSQVKPQDESAAQSQTAVLHSATHINNNKQDNSCLSLTLQPVLLSTALVEIADSKNKYHTIRALLDSGSQQCFIAEPLCKKLNTQMLQSTVQVTGIGHCVTQSTQSCEIKLRSKTNNYKRNLKCLVLPDITTPLPSLNINNINFNIPDHVTLADPNFYLPRAIQLLIGADLFWELLNEGLIRLSAGPCLQNTKLGWIISGPIQTKNLRINQISCNFIQTLDIQLKKFWELEEVITPSDNYSKNERACENLFSSTTLRDDKGRFSVRIPLKESADSLGDTFSLAENRFLSLERKLAHNPDYKIMYSTFLQEYLSLGHMSRITSYSFPTYFLPHHGVLRENSSTTKLRVVFDASAKSTSSKSLNDIQLTGPILQNDIFSILIRFRKHRYIACADVEKMFRQVLIQPDQRNLQCILWRENPSDPLEMYQLNTVTYGTASAPYLSMRCIRQLAIDCNDDIVSQVIKEDIYVDDLITGHDDKRILTKICNSVSEVLSSGCFILRKWLYNYDTVEADTNTLYNNSSSKEMSLGENCQNKTLGLGWFCASDELHFITKLDNGSTPVVTKRIILSIVSQIYDPLGLLSPTIIIAKIILQKLWICKTGWDDPIPQHIELNWNNFIKTLNCLHNIRVPRHVIGNFCDDIQVELHIFCDASQSAYGACAYVRSFSSNNNDSVDALSVRLLCAKGKVAPVKPVSIPRLELCAALLGARLYSKIGKVIKMKFKRVYLWSDSTTVLGWLNIAPSSLKPFVQNRVVEINELTEGCSWLHIQGKQNPADLVSRGVSIDALQGCDLWWHGPSCLREPNSSWKKGHTSVYHNINFDELPELKLTTAAMECQVGTDLNLFNRLSSLNRLKHTMAYVLRFISNTRIKLKSNRAYGALSFNELHNSMVILSRLSQRESFPVEYERLKNNLPIKSNRHLSGLNLFLDEYELMRVGGRIKNSFEFTFDKKHPVVLSSKHNFTILLFKYEHHRLLHAGPQLLLSTLRENWWPVGGRNLSKKTTRNCVVCTRVKGKTIKAQMGNLPVERLESEFPFYRCGVDYAGPLYILSRKGRGAKLEKCYICLFICFSTKAIHLELVTSLSTEAYILTLKRFISRRGKPAEIFSDNGSNFVGASKEFNTFINNKKNINSIIDYTANENIKFSFIPPYSPHVGGLWEAGVKSCKHHLRRVVGNAHLTYEELSTVLALIESILNSRPISPLSSDPADALPLTPAHFLIGRPLTAAACDDVTTTPTLRLSRYARVEQLRQHFWQRWTKEYITELQMRTKWKNKDQDIKPDTLVLIKEDNLPPLKWRLGRVTKTFTGNDGISRVADITTATGLIRRAYTKLCPLLLDSEEDGSRAASS